MDERQVEVRVEMRSAYEFVVRFSPDMPTLATDEAPPLGEGKGPTPAMVLAGAVANCLAASLAFCLRKSRVEPEALGATAVATIARNERGRQRIARMDVSIDVRVPEADRAKLERCHGLFEDFCIVTQSVRQGFPVEVKVVA